MVGATRVVSRKVLIGFALIRGFVSRASHSCRRGQTRCGRHVFSSSRFILRRRSAPRVLQHLRSNLDRTQYSCETIGAIMIRAVSVVYAPDNRPVADTPLNKDHGRQCAQVTKSGDSCCGGRLCRQASGAGEVASLPLRSRRWMDRNRSVCACVAAIVPALPTSCSRSALPCDGRNWN
jgi:hypothetical protein